MITAPRTLASASCAASRRGAAAALTLALTLVLVALVGPSAAYAAPTWLGPVAVHEESEEVEGVGLAFDPSGDAVAVWQDWTGSEEVIQSASREAGQSWTQPVEISEAGQSAEVPRVATDVHGDALAVWQRSDGSNEIVQASYRPAGGSFESPVNLSEAGESAYHPQVAFDPQGDAIAVWSLFDGSHYILQAAYRPAGGSFQSPVVVSESAGNVEKPRVAFDRQGDALVVWELAGASDSVQAAYRPAGGSFQSPVQLSEEGHNAQSPAVAVDQAGDALAVWTQQATFGEYVVHASLRPAGGSFGAPVSVSEEGQTAFDPALAFDAAGDAFVIWDDGTTGRVQSAFRPAAGSFRSPVNLSEPGANVIEQQIAVDAVGDAIAVFQRNGVVQAAVERAGGSFAPPIDLSEGEGGSYEPQIAFDEQGNALAVWSSSGLFEADPYDAAGPQLRSLAIPASGVAGEALSFSVSPLDVFSALGETSWSFGDGASAHGAGVSHTYSAPGAYTVRVESADVLGNQSATEATVVIGAATSSPGTPAPGVSSGTTPGAGRPAPSARASITPLSISVNHSSGAITLTLRLSGAGHLSAIATEADPVSWSTAASASALHAGHGRFAYATGSLAMPGAGVAHLTMKLTTGGRRIILRHRGRRWALHVFVTIDFTSQGGANAAAVRKVEIFPRAR